MTLTSKHLKYSAKPNKHIYYYPLIEKEKQCHHFMLSQSFWLSTKSDEYMNEVVETVN